MKIFSVSVWLTHNKCGFKWLSDMFDLLFVRFNMSTQNSSVLNGVHLLIVLQSGLNLFLAFIWEQVRSSVLRACLHKVIRTLRILLLCTSLHWLAFNKDIWLDVLDEFNELVRWEMSSFFTNFKRNHVVVSWSFLTIKGAIKMKILLIALSRGIITFLLLGCIHCFLDKSLAN